MTHQKKKIDIQQDVTNKILKALEAGVAPWRKDWKNGSSSFIMPKRENGEFYQGINILLLWEAAEEKGFFSQYWFTYKKASELGAQVKKGSKGTHIYFYGTSKKKDENDKENIFKFLKGTTVFNADQIESLDEKYYSAPKMINNNNNERVKTLETFFKNTGAEIIEQGNSAHYTPSKDIVSMPPLNTFENSNAFYFTLAHEMAHWTGSPKRLNREFGKKMNDQKYAAEELVAELSAMFTMLNCGQVPDFSNSASYIDHWLSALKNDKTFIFKAASKASQATNYLLDLQEKYEGKKAA